MVALNALLTRAISSFSGTSAMGAVWFLAADSSLRACDVDGVPPWLRSGAVNAVQPRVGSRKSEISALSLPLTSLVALGIAAALAALICAVWPLPLSR